MNLLYYMDALKRFDRHSETDQKNPFLIIADEAQRIVMSAYDGLADHNTVHTRLIKPGPPSFSTHNRPQSYILRSGEDMLLLNLQTRITFCAADEMCAKHSTNKFSKKKKFFKRSYGFIRGRGTPTSMRKNTG